MYRDDAAIKQHVVLTVITVVVCAFFSVAYLKYTAHQAELYRLAIVIEKDDNQLYDYCATTSAGNALAHGTVTSTTFVTFTELGQQPYLQARKVRQEYTKHKNEKKDKDGNVTVTYTYSWDYSTEWNTQTPRVQFMTHDYPTSNLKLPSYRVNLTKLGITNSSNYIYEYPWRSWSPSVGDYRWYYEATPNGIDGSILVHLYNNSAEFISSFYGYQTPEQVVGDKVEAMQSGPTVSIIVSIVIIIVANLGIAYLRGKGYI